ncbi:MAG: hypothetical protein H8E79_04360 [Desulfobulbaceae bacterium]|uniref:Uncharacterized protein n=1 Tax=Candidatus Desulfatifera sulfidica TaxID=2841691 RepID=A0A8J6NBC8_9BACT|nr:hypothetical protein [Candidatus Desulfatifera sulfidica]
MAAGESFDFICAGDIVGKMDRVILYAGGEITGIEKRAGGTVIGVCKSEPKAESTL